MAHSSDHCSPACVFFKWLFGLLYLLATLASLFEVVHTHWVSNQLVFGSGNSALSLIAFVLSLMALSKQMKACMGSCEVCSKR